MFRKSLAHLPSLSSFSKPIPKHEESTSDSFNDVDQENVMEESTFPMLPRTPSSKKSQSSTTVLGMSSHPNQQPHTPAPSKLMPVKQAPGSNRKSLVAEAYQRPETIPEICDIVSTDFQIWAKSKKSEWEEEHQLFLKSLDDALKQAESLRLEIDRKKKEEDDLNAIYQSEQEKEQELQQRLLQLEEEKNDILHESVSLEAKIRDMEQDLDTRRAVLLEKRKRREISACEAQPDVDFYKHMLAMTIESLRPDVIKFSFTNVNARDWNQVYSITLDVESAYKAISCVPSLDGINELVDWLNESRDLYQFLKIVRSRFANLAELQLSQ